MACSTTGCYISNFGTSVMTKDGAFNYIAGRAATYFVSLMHGTTFTRTRFVDCQNFRNKCINDTDGSHADCDYSASVEGDQICSD